MICGHTDMSKIRKFDTKVQYLKYKVLREVARHAWDDLLPEPATKEEKVKLLLIGQA